MFNDEYLDNLPNDPLLSLNEIVNKTIDHWSGFAPGSEIDDFDTFLEAHAIARALAENVKNFDFAAPDLKGSPNEMLACIIEYMEGVKASISTHLVELKMSQFNARYSAKYGNIFAYEFSEGDLARIQTLINELRDVISESELFENEHKQRLMSRLERLQSEMHKKMADLDRFWGLVGDAGVAMAKLGENAKPIVDRIREISNIVWRTQSRAEELPSDTPMDMISKGEEKA